MTQFNIVTNITSLIAQNQLNKNTSALQKAMQILSTGLKINVAKDDPATFTISERFNTEITGNNQILENIQSGVSILNIAEGNMTSIEADLRRIRDLAVQGANGFYSEDSQNAIIDEMQVRIDNINQVAKTTNFNGINLLDGSLEQMLIQIGFGSDELTNTIDLKSTMQNCTVDKDNGLDIDLTEANLIKGTVTADDFAAYIDKIDEALSKVSGYISNAGAQYNKLTSTQDNISVLVNNQIEAKSTLVDADVAKASSDVLKYQILQQSSVSLLKQANTIPEMALSLLQ